MIFLKAVIFLVKIFVYFSQGKAEEAIRYMKIFADICETNCDWVQLCRACHMLGLIYDHIGNFREAQNYMVKAFDMPNFVSVSIPRKLNPFFCVIESSLV